MMKVQSSRHSRVYLPSLESFLTIALAILMAALPLLR